MKCVALGPATLYLGDAAEVVPTLDMTFDLMVTDPPWGVAFKGRRRTTGGGFDIIHGDRGEVDVPAIINACVRRIRRGRHVYVFGPARLLGSVEHIASPCELIWDKGLPGLSDPALPWAPEHEPISFGVVEISRANRAKGAGAVAARLRQGSVLQGARPHSGGADRHPNEKPVEVLRRFVEASSHHGDLVFDPFMGSGSTVVAALLEGRRAVGIEIDERYFNLAVERVQRLLPTLRQLESA